MLKFLSFLLTGLLIGCSKPQSQDDLIPSAVVTGQQLTRSQLSWSLEQLGIYTLDLKTPDQFYEIPDPDWVKNVLLPAFPRFARAMGAWDYREGSNDCEDFARLFATFATLAYNKSSRGGKGMGFAVGEFWNEGDRHALNVFVCPSPSGPVLRFIEPQGPSLTNTIVRDYANVRFLRF